MILSSRYSIWKLKSTFWSNCVKHTALNTILMLIVGINLVYIIIAYLEYTHKSTNTIHHHCHPALINNKKAWLDFFSKVHPAQ